MTSLLLLTCLFFQTPDTSTLRGRVIDQSHAVVPMVQVTVTNAVVKRTAQTDESGNYSIAGLPIGDYDVIASKQGFAEMKPVKRHACRWDYGRRGAATQCIGRTNAGYGDGGGG